MRSGTMRRVWCERIPELALMKPGTLYVAGAYAIASHLCACGCGGEVVTPLDEGGWTLGTGPTLRPSIGNMATCRAHYYVTDGSVEWL